MDWAYEIAKKMVKFPNISSHDRLVAEITQALRDEREACAEVAASCGADMSLDSMTAEEVARSIRARS
jgi:hypothetical protein